MKEGKRTWKKQDRRPGEVVEKGRWMRGATEIS